MLRQGPPFEIVEDVEVAAYEAQRKNEEAWLCLLAQEVFHITFVDHDKRYYHLLNIANHSTDIR